MSKIMKKFSITILFALCIFIMTGTNADAAAKEYKEIKYHECINQSVNTRIKVGKYYFHFDKDVNYVRYSKKSNDKGKRIKKNPTQIFTNGTYAYFLGDDEAIYRVTLSNNKVKKIKKPKAGTCNLIVNVYGNDIFYMDCTINDDGTLRAYDVKTKKTRTIRKKVSVEGICAYGRYVVFSIGKNGSFYDCKAKKTIKYASDVKYNMIKYVEGKYIYYVNTKGKIVRYKIAKKYTSKNAKVIGALPDTQYGSDATGMVMGYKNGKMYYDYTEFTYGESEDDITITDYRAVIDVKTAKVLSKKVIEFE